MRLENDSEEEIDDLLEDPSTISEFCDLLMEEAEERGEKKFLKK